jgi:NAD(P)-dependent dehydrogenase (short-subunit alcohol dehydrogenase family)
MQLENKVAIVTGAASGIGKGIAALFAREGARVVIADLNKRGADATAAELGGAKRAIGVAVDVTDEAATADCVALRSRRSAGSISSCLTPEFRPSPRSTSLILANGSSFLPFISTALF